MTRVRNLRIGHIIYDTSNQHYSPQSTGSASIVLSDSSLSAVTCGLTALTGGATAQFAFRELRPIYMEIVSRIIRVFYFITP